MCTPSSPATCASKLWFISKINYAIFGDQCYRSKWMQYCINTNDKYSKVQCNGYNHWSIYRAVGYLYSTASHHLIAVATIDRFSVCLRSQLLSRIRHSLPICCLGEISLLIYYIILFYILKTINWYVFFFFYLMKQDFDGVRVLSQTASLLPSIGIASKLSNGNFGKVCLENAFTLIWWISQ